MTETSLERKLVELVREAEKDSIRPILAGGLGVLLRVRFARVRNELTLADPPIARATRDLDLLLPAEVVVDASRMEVFRGVLDRLGYQEVEGARYYQFVGGSGAAAVKVDLHAEPPHETSGVKMDSRRIRAHGYRLLHARRLDEALGSEMHPVPIAMLSNGAVVAAPEGGSVEVLTPNLFTFWAMKLTALRDNLHNREDDEGRRHAYDMYALWASTSEQVWSDGTSVGEFTRGAPQRNEIREAVTELFTGTDAIGQIRLREALRVEGVEAGGDELERFRHDLLELLGSLC